MPANSNTPKPSRRIADLVKANLGTITRNLNNFWCRQAEDMIAGGVARHDVAESLMTVGITYGAVTMGAPALAAHLRAVAAMYERADIIGAQQPPENFGGSH
ncbi:hypothetical protein KQX64_03345 [Rhodopseudomonas palustris]|nr:hypothetical protein KQX64_03345 [Rhodopseudomonas palustris]